MYNTFSFLCGVIKGFTVMDRLWGRNILDVLGYKVEINTHFTFLYNTINCDIAVRKDAAIQSQYSEAYEYSVVKI